MLPSAHPVADLQSRFTDGVYTYQTRLFFLVIYTRQFFLALAASVTTTNPTGQFVLILIGEVAQVSGILFWAPFAEMLENRVQALLGAIRIAVMCLYAAMASQPMGSPRLNSLSIAVACLHLLVCAFVLDSL